MADFLEILGNEKKNAYHTHFFFPTNAGNSSVKLVSIEMSNQQEEIHRADDECSTLILIKGPLY